MRNRLVSAGTFCLLLAACDYHGRTPRFDPRDWANGSERSSLHKTKLPPDLESDCPMAQPGKRTSVCISADEQVYGKGKPIRVKVAWRNAPPQASLVLYLERDVGRAEQPSYFGPVGPLVGSPIAVASTGQGIFTWPGRMAHCRGRPDWCGKPAEIGRFRIRAALFGKSRFEIASWQEKEPGEILVQSASAPFVISGQPDLEPLARILSSLAETFEQGHSAEGALATELSGARLKIYETPLGRICTDFRAYPPYQAKVSACTWRASITGDAGLRTPSVDAMTVTGWIRYPENRFGLDQAGTIARNLASGPYLRRVESRSERDPDDIRSQARREGGLSNWLRRNPLAGTFLHEGIQRTIYRGDLGGAWSILVFEIMAGGRPPADRYFADQVLVLVRPDRTACVIEVAPYHATLRHDPRHGPLSCPRRGSG